MAHHEEKHHRHRREREEMHSRHLREHRDLHDAHEAEHRELLASLNNQGSPDTSPQMPQPQSQPGMGQGGGMTTPGGMGASPQSRGAF